MQYQHQDQCGGKMIHDIGQEEDLHVSKPDEHDRNFDVVRASCNNLDSIMSVILTELESSMSQRQIDIVYKIDVGADSNLMPFKIFKKLFLKLTLEQLCTTKIMLWF